MIGWSFEIGVVVFVVLVVVVVVVGVLVALVRARRRARFLEAVARRPRVELEPGEEARVVRFEVVPGGLPRGPSASVVYVDELDAWQRSTGEHGAVERF